MSEEQLKAFLEKVQSDTNIQEKLKAANARHQTEAAIEIAKEAGFAITAEDIQSMQSAPVVSDTVVSDSELEGAAGGRELVSGSWMGRCCSTADSWCRQTVDGHCQSRNTAKAGGC